MSMLPRKIAIFGRPGSGKSTFACDLASTLNIPLHHLDKYFFVSHWVERDYDEFLSIQQNLVETDAWVIDGNSVRSLEMRWSKADLVVYFNYPRWICLYRILKRRFLSGGRSIDDRAEGCLETISKKLLRYMWDFEKRETLRIATLREKYPHTSFVEVKCDTDAQKLKAGLT